MSSKDPEHHPNSSNPKESDILKRLSQEVGYIPESTDRPSRCRAIVFNPDGTKVLGILRQRPGREPYVVYPGGGVDDEDQSAMAAVRRELSEELGLSDDDVYLNGRVLSFDDEVGHDQFYYLGQAVEEFKGLTIHGPEAKRDYAVSGTYNPMWIDVSDIENANFQPSEISRIIIEHR